jgi:ribosome assembly protein YihI (activator of Der GTPase)
MDNLGILILSIFVMIAFLVFIIASIKEISKMEKEPYQYKKPVFGRDALYNLLENLFNDNKLSVKEKKNLLKTIDRTISDMESDGMYFPEEIKDELEKQREELYCEYSGLPSVRAYDTDQI